MTLLRGLVLILLLGLSGCSIFKLEPVEHSLYRLTSGSTATFPGSAFAQRRLVVPEARSGPFLNSHRILFSADGVEFGYYQFASFTEPPPKRLSELLVESLDRSGLFKAASQSTGSALGDLQLNLEVNDFYHRTADEPGTIEIRLSVELIDLTKSEIIGSKKISRSEPVEDYNSRGAVDAMSKATTSAINEILDWIAKL